MEAAGGSSGGDRSKSPIPSDWLDQIGISASPDGPAFCILAHSMAYSFLVERSISMAGVCEAGIVGAGSNSGRYRCRCRWNRWTLCLAKHLLVPERMLWLARCDVLMAGSMEACPIWRGSSAWWRCPGGRSSRGVRTNICFAHMDLSQSHTPHWYRCRPQHTPTTTTTTTTQSCGSFSKASSPSRKLAGDVVMQGTAWRGLRRTAGGNVQSRVHFPLLTRSRADTSPSRDEEGRFDALSRSRTLGE